MERHTSYRFPKAMRLASKKEIDALFTLGKTFSHGPFRVFYRFCEPAHPCLPGCSIAVTVPKKHLKSAVKRNLVKRRIRESFRLQYPHKLEPALTLSHTRLLFLCLYLPHEVKPWHFMAEKMEGLLSRFSELCEKSVELPADSLN